MKVGWQQKARKWYMHNGATADPSGIGKRMFRGIACIHDAIYNGELGMPIFTDSGVLP